MLDTKAAFYVVDNLKIYTWKGKECPKELRKKILVGIDEFLSAIGFKVTAGRDSSATSTLFSCLLTLFRSRLLHSYSNLILGATANRRTEPGHRDCSFQAVVLLLEGG